MGLMDKVRAQGSQLAQVAQDAAREGKVKLDQAQAKRRADALFRDLGAAVYAERTGRGSPDSKDRIDRLVERAVPAGGRSGAGRDGRQRLLGCEPVRRERDWRQRVRGERVRGERVRGQRERGSGTSASADQRERDRRERDGGGEAGAGPARAGTPGAGPARAGPARRGPARAERAAPGRRASPGGQRSVSGRRPGRRSWTARRTSSGRSGGWRRMSRCRMSRCRWWLPCSRWCRAGS